jgi:hypothetical protein
MLAYDNGHAVRVSSTGKGSGDAKSSLFPSRIAVAARAPPVVLGLSLRLSAAFGLSLTCAWARLDHVKAEATR